MLRGRRARPGARQDRRTAQVDAGKESWLKEREWRFGVAPSSSNQLLVRTCRRAIGNRWLVLVGAGWWQVLSPAESPTIPPCHHAAGDAACQGAVIVLRQTKIVKIYNAGETSKICARLGDLTSKLLYGVTLALALPHIYSYCDAWAGISTGSEAHLLNPLTPAQLCWCNCPN